MWHEKHNYRHLKALNLSCSVLYNNTGPCPSLLSVYASVLLKPRRGRLPLSCSSTGGGSGQSKLECAGSLSPYATVSSVLTRQIWDKAETDKLPFYRFVPACFCWILYFFFFFFFLAFEPKPPEDPSDSEKRTSFLETFYAPSEESSILFSIVQKCPWPTSSVCASFGTS